MMVVGLVFGVADSARAASEPEPTQSEAASLPPVDVLQVSGLFDGVLVDEITKALDRAADDGAQALVLQVNTRGSVVGRDDMAELFHKVRNAAVPVAIWVGPSGARLYGLPAQLLAAADAAGIAPGARLGRTGTQLVSSPEIANLPDELRAGTAGAREAWDLGVVTLGTPDDGVPAIRNMISALDELAADGVVLDTALQRDDGGTIADDITTVRFHKLSLTAQLFHTAASAPVAYLLFIIGMALLIFEFFTAGVGIAGVVGATCLALGAFGLGALPVRGWAVALLVFSMFAFAVDIQVGIPRLWTGVGLVSLTVGSWFLFGSADGQSLRLSWLTLVIGLGGAAIAFITGMPSMVRTRFATPTIGREWMIGEIGSALGPVHPEGLVQLGAARWRARTNRSLDIKAGDRVRVIGIDGVTLEVEPEAGGARDYRERRGKRSAETPED